MAKNLPQPEEFDELEDDQEFVPSRGRRWRWLGVLLALAVVLAGSFELAYWGKVYPGVTANGVNLGGMSRVAATAKLKDRLSEFTGGALAIRYGDRTMRIPVNDLGAHYDTATVVNQAYNYGRRGGWRQLLVEHARALLGRPIDLLAYSYSDNKLSPYLAEISEDVATPVIEATLTFNDNHAQVTPAEAGQRLDIGQLIWQVDYALGHTNDAIIEAPVYELQPLVTTAALETAAAQADRYLAGPITLSYGETVKEVDLATITQWIQIKHTPLSGFLVTHQLTDLYPPVTGVQLSLNQTDIKAYVAELATKADVAPRNAALTMDGEAVVIAQASRTGATMDQAGAVNLITAALNQPADQRSLKLELKVTQPEVSETNLPDLGIKELISEGFSSFPGSTAARLTNVRVGASKFDGALLKPGDVFSFGAILGEVGPAQGYKPELVILADHEEKQYGGGMCQVSSTAFRAALNAGLPIVERRNHSFAISYYTAPYGIQGVDATIYYPQTDFKFKNDTSHYILIQTEMVGTTLRFRYYGTKTKTGRIRGPQLVSGSLDFTKPSHTVFYRDVLDLSGKVIKTDTFHSYYKSSKDFPVQTEFNN